MKSDYYDIGIQLKDDEWARLDILAEELGSTKPHLNIFSADDLRHVLETTDQAGRFEINEDGDVRKVQRDNRVARSGAPDNGNKHENCQATVKWRFYEMARWRRSVLRRLLKSCLLYTSPSPRD